MTVSFKLVRETFTSRVTLDRPNLKIMVEYLKGPFSNLENRWTFEPKSETDCDVGFFLSYEFRSRMLAMLMGTMFDTAFQRFAAAFEKRADAVYGKGGADGQAKAFKFRLIETKMPRHRRSRRDRPAAARHCHNACGLFPAPRPGRRA